MTLIIEIGHFDIQKLLYMNYLIYDIKMQFKVQKWID